MKKYKIISIILVFCLIIGGSTLTLILKEDDELSSWERRKLQQFPTFSYERVTDGSFTKDLVTYITDQFPFRNELRRLKAQIHFNVFRQKDNSGIYISSGSASKIDSKINEGSVKHFLSCIDSVYSTYIKDTNCKSYYSIIPDKNYFLAEAGGYPCLDYGELYRVLSENLSYMNGIEINHLLSGEDYYTTDTHWRQEKIVNVANEIRQQMGLSPVTDYTENTMGEFYGVYYGQSALPLKPDTIKYLTSSEIDACYTVNFEKNKTGKVYNKEDYESLDAYNFFLFGAVPVAEINNPNGDKDKELVIFRDSFSSSLAPLLLSSYSKVTLIDIRYIAPELIENYVEFDSQDVLFIYSTLLVNDSSTMKMVSK